MQRVVGQPFPFMRLSGARGENVPHEERSIRIRHLQEFAIHVQACCTQVSFVGNRVPGIRKLCHRLHKLFIVRLRKSLYQTHHESVAL